MKLLYFLIIVLIIYYIGTKINVVHIDTLPTEQQSELENRSKIRSMIMDNHIKEKLNKKVLKKTDFTFKENELLKYKDMYSATGAHTRDYKHDYFDLLSEPHMKLPKARDIYILLRSEFIDTEYIRDQYKFNVTGQPSVSRYPSRNTITQDKKYIKQIKRDMASWNNLFPKYYDTNKKLIQIAEIKLIFITETDFEFVIQGMVKLIYQGKSMHFRFEYYGRIDRTDDFINGGTDTYMLQLSSLRPLTKSEFDSKIDGKYLDEKAPFASISSQMKYVDKVNQQHQEEMGL